MKAAAGRNQGRASCTPRPSPPPGPRPAFTLLEVLLALALGTALLTVLWAGVSLHLRAYDSGRTEIEQTQVARALLRKMEADLRRVLPQPENSPIATTRPDPPDPLSHGEPPVDAPAAEGTGAEFTLNPSATLLGDARQLRLQVRQSSHGRGVELPVGGADAEKIKFPDDVRTICYWLAQPELSAEQGHVPRGAGVVRWEADWLPGSTAPRPQDNAPDTGSHRPLSQPGAPSEDDRLAAFYRSELPPQPGEHADQAVLVADQVAGLRLRYSDGALWHDAWNSAQHGRLPVAVEIALFLSRNDESIVAMAGATDEAWPDFRLVVPIPLDGPPPPKPADPGRGETQATEGLP